MSDGRAQTNTAGSDQTDRMLKVRPGADVREEIAQAALAEEIDIELNRAAEPGNPNDFPSGAG